MATNQPESVKARLSRLEILFANSGETVTAQSQAIDALTANVNRNSIAIDALTANVNRNSTAIDALTANVNRNSIAIDALTANVSQQSDTIDVLVANITQLTENFNNLSEQTSRNIRNLVEQAAQDRQQAAIDRQAWQAETQRIWEYLLQQRGNGRQGA
jgi:uncharacterized coiled-coil protein SlyX